MKFYYKFQTLKVLFVNVVNDKRVSEFMGFLKGKSSLQIFYRHPEYGSKWKRNFWARGYYVATVGNVNEATIVEYIKQQEETDKLQG